MILLNALLATATCMSAHEPDRLLDDYRAAISAPGESRGTWSSRYAFQSAGLTGESTVTIDLQTGIYRKELRAGIMTGGEGFDGHLAWLRDLSGFVTPQEGGDRLSLAINEAYRNANLWLRADRGGASLESIGCGGIRVTPPGGKPFEAWFDANTRTLHRLRETQSFATTMETTFDDYRSVDGRVVPTRIEVMHGDSPDSKETLLLKGVSHGEAKLSAAYAMPDDNPRDWKLPPAGETTLPFRLVNNHILIDVKVDGRGPFAFMVDTGGHNILTPSTVAALGLNVKGSTSTSGSGETVVAGGYARVGEIDAGGAVLADQTFLTLEFSPPQVEGLQLGGMLGAEFCERFVVTIDYGAHTITLIDPKRFEPAKQTPLGIPLPMRYYLHMPQVDGAVDGRSARFNIDTGARDELVLTSTFVASQGLRDEYPRGVTMTTGWGVGGPSRTYSVRPGAVSLGPATVQRPVVGLSAATKGVFGDTSFDGNVGSGLLKRFVVTLDYARKTLYLALLAKTDPDTGSFDRMGMWLNLGSDGLVVMDVLPGGPADVAGLKVGDLIAAIDDVAHDQRSLSDTRRAMKLVSPQRPVAIRYRRMATGLETIVQPRELLPR
jgi:hypothetical protein